MTRVRHDLVARLWRGRDPFLDQPPDLRAVDMRRATPDLAYVATSVAAAPAGVVVDVGAGMGGSTLAFARALRSGRVNAAVVAIDTFLGDATDWATDEAFEGMQYEAGRSSLYPRFVSNVLQAGLGNLVVPLTLDATTAASVFARFGVAASIVHLDAGDDAASIRSYLDAWWPLLMPRGRLIGRAGPEEAWDAYEAFFAAQGVDAMFQDGAWQAVKPGGADPITNPQLGNEVSGLDVPRPRQVVVAAPIALAAMREAGADQATGAAEVVALKTEAMKDRHFGGPSAALLTHTGFDPDELRAYTERAVQKLGADVFARRARAAGDDPYRVAEKCVLQIILADRLPKDMAAESRGHAIRDIVQDYCERKYGTESHARPAGWRMPAEAEKDAA
jgi:Methyltransferase domain